MQVPTGDRWRFVPLETGATTAPFPLKTDQARSSSQRSSIM